MRPMKHRLRVRDVQGTGVTLCAANRVSVLDRTCWCRPDCTARPTYLVQRTSKKRPRCHDTRGIHMPDQAQARSLVTQDSHLCYQIMQNEHKHLHRVVFSVCLHKHYWKSIGIHVVMPVRRISTCHSISAECACRSISAQCVYSLP